MDTWISGLRNEHHLGHCTAEYSPTGQGWRPVLGLLFAIALLLSTGCSMLNHTTYRGKIIDAETLKPIEGVVVIAQWLECWPGIGAGELCDFEMVRETLTDKNGDWSITGPRGEDKEAHGYIRGILSFVIPYTQSPHFYTYKRGYVCITKGQGEFEAFPFINDEKGIEGVILIRPGDTLDESHKFFEKYGGLFWPFIPMKNPRQKLEALDFDFKYPEKVEVIESEGRKFSNEYVVYGLARAKTSQDFRFAPNLSLHSEAMDRLRIFPRIIDKDSSEPFKGYE